MIRTWSLLAVAVPATFTAKALEPAELDGLLQSSTRITLVDIRDESLFRHGHIPNAINIPERVLVLKKLPPQDYVVVYGGGLGMENTAEAVRILNEKPGIKAEMLEGGYAGWQTHKGTTTQAAGLHQEALNVVTYQRLQDISTAEDFVLVDLRKEPQPDNPPRELTRQGAAAPATGLTPLAEKFPGRSVVKSPFEVPGVAKPGRLGRQSATAGEPVPLMVLVDNGEGEAQKMARILKANGVHRVVILAGGEKILKRDGAPGLQRRGIGTLTVEADDEVE
jgi:rhodanese-related sulfurtransferase